MGDVSSMMHGVEKRGTGKDRRIAVVTAPYAGRERRVADRRQIVVLEITFREWAMHLIHFKKKLVSRQKRLAERQARKAEERQQRLAKMRQQK